MRTSDRSGTFGALRRRFSGWRLLTMVGAPITLVSAFLMFVVPQPSSLAAVSGYQNLSNGATLGTTNENCRSLVVGANTPKVIKTLLPGSQQYPGGTLHYQV